MRTNEMRLAIALAALLGWIGAWPSATPNTVIRWNSAALQGIRGGVQMPKIIRLIMVLVLFPGLSSAQSTTRPKYFDHARIQHDGSEVTVAANDSIPLFQALYGVRLEYGWLVNWESAPGYSRFDVVDDTGPRWRASHPDAKGVTRPAGGQFTCTLPEPKESDADAQRLVLARLVQQYNATDNPGRYVLRADASGHFTIVGEEVRDETGAPQKITPLLDTPVSIARATRSVDAAIESVLAALESATGKKVIFGAVSRSLFRTSQVTMGGENSPAREVLQQALAATKQAIQYDLFFNADVPVYVLNVSPEMREESDGIGGQRLIPVEPSRQR